MLREMGTFGAVMTVILLVLIAIKSILHYLNPKSLMTAYITKESIWLITLLREKALHCRKSIRM